MEIIVSEGSGFCFGVKRALAIAEKTLSASEGRPVHTYGPIVHNSQVVETLRRRGISPMDSLTPGTGDLVLRSHGVSPEIMERAVRMGYRVVDATCPLVKKIHNIVTSLVREKIPVVIIGKSTHPEVQAIAGYGGADCAVIDEEKDLKKAECWDRLGIVVQTTRAMDDFLKWSSRLIAGASQCRVFNTICFESLRRQEKVAELALGVDVMIVLGGRHSSNTARLAAIAAGKCRRTHLVESERELNLAWFAGAKKVGLACGASTPVEHLEALKDSILRLCEKEGRM